MTEIIIATSGLIMFIDTLFKRLNIYDKIQILGSKSKYKKIYELSHCQFCILFWITTAFCLILATLIKLEWHYIAIPFIVSGITSKLNNLSK